MDGPQVYALIDPRDEAVRYVGQAHRLGQRLASHVSRAKRHQGRDMLPVSVWIRELVAEGLKPRLEVLDPEPDDYAEARWIGAFLRGPNGHRLTNVNVPDEAESLRRVLAWAEARGKDRHFYAGKYWQRQVDPTTQASRWLNVPHPQQRRA